MKAVNIDPSSFPNPFEQEDDDMSEEQLTQHPQSRAVCPKCGSDDCRFTSPTNHWCRTCGYHFSPPPQEAREEKTLRKVAERIVRAVETVSHSLNGPRFAFVEFINEIESILSAECPWMNIGHVSELARLRDKLEQVKKERDEAVNGLVNKSVFKTASHQAVEAERDSLREQLSAEKEKSAILQSHVDNADIYLEQNRLNYRARVERLEKERGDALLDRTGAMMERDELQKRISDLEAECKAWNESTAPGHRMAAEAMIENDELQKRVKELEMERDEAVQYRTGHLPTCSGFDLEQQRCGCGYLEGYAYRDIIESTVEMAAKLSTALSQLEAERAKTKIAADALRAVRRGLCYPDEYFDVARAALVQIES